MLSTVHEPFAMIRAGVWSRMNESTSAQVWVEGQWIVANGFVKRAAVNGWSHGPIPPPFPSGKGELA